VYAVAAPATDEPVTELNVVELTEPQKYAVLPDNADDVLYNPT